MWILCIALVELARIWLVVRMVQYTLFFGNTSYWTIALIVAADWFCMSVMSQVLNAFWPYYPSDYLRRDSWLGNWLRKRIHFQSELFGGDLDPSVKYIFASHSHGILSTVQLLMFMLYTDDSVLKTIPANTVSTIGSELMIFPLTNLICRLLGARSISPKNLEEALKSDQHVSIVPGGAKEISFSRCDTKNELHILKREGFLKLAYALKKPVVPILTLGNWCMYNVYSGPVWLQKFCLKHLNYGFPVFALGWYGTIVPHHTAFVRNLILAPVVVKEGETEREYIDRYYDGLFKIAKEYNIDLHLVSPDNIGAYLHIEQLRKESKH